MILFKIDPQSLSLLPLKGNGPWAVYMDTVAFWGSTESVKIESRYIHLL